MRKFYALCLCLCVALGISAQTLTNLAYFPFTGNAASPNTPTSYMAAYGAQAGTAGLYLDGTHGSSAWLQASELTSNGGSNLNLQYGETNGQDLATINNSANGKSIVFHFSTTGFQNVVLTLAARRSAQGFNSTEWAYSTDGTNFTTLPATFSTVPSTAATYELKTLDFNGITAIEDQADVYLRCTYDGAQSASASFRIDNVLIAAYPAGPDVWAPTVSTVVPNDSVTVTVTFNEALDATTAQTAANYVMDNNVTVSAATLNSNVVTLTTSPMTEGNTYTLIVNNVEDIAGNAMAPDTIVFSYGVSSEFVCANIAELRSKFPFTDNSAAFNDNVEYKLESEVIVTAVASYNNQKVIQDATGAILIYDPSGVLGNYNVGDKIKDVYGTLTNYWGFLEFKPTAPCGPAIDIFQDVTPLTITLSQLADNNFMIDHQAELIQLEDVTFTGTGTFQVLNTYELNQNGTTLTAVYPYFQDANYIGSDIPTNMLNIRGVNFATSKIGNNHPPFGYYIVPRTTSDFLAVAIRDYEEYGVAVYPNPAVDNIRIETEVPVESIALYDVNGKRVMLAEVSDNTVSVAALPTGLYFARLYVQGRQVGVAKIVKK